MNETEMKQRTKRFALDILRLVADLPKTTEGRIVGHQLIRCSTSVGANYRNHRGFTKNGRRLSMRLSQTNNSKFKIQKSEML